MSALEKHHRLAAVMEFTGLTEPSIYRLMADDKFPRPKKMSERTVAWAESALVAYMESRPLADAA